MTSSPTPLLASHSTIAHSTLSQLSTPFIGRQRELDELSTRLTNPQVRLVTVQGIGGMGKTRLAIEAAKRVQANFADGTVFVPLTAIPTPDELVPAICAALKVSLSQGDAQAQLTGLIAALHTKECLLILDNLEHLLAPPAFVTQTTTIIGELISQTERLKLLITSREALRLSNETSYRLDGLSDDELNDNALSDAVALFVQSAGQAQVDFQLRPSDEATVRRICQLVGGMPLGIELAASWISLLTPDEIAAELERNLDLLTTDDHGKSARHRSISAVLDQSWEMLPANERDVIERLSVFRGSFTREMAAQVADASLITLAQLVTKSLVRRTDNNRYDLHELMRQYAHSRLVKRRADEETHRKHARALTLYAEREVMRFYNPQSHLVRKQFELDLGNFRAALAWCSDTLSATTPHATDDAELDAELGLRLAVALVRFYRDLPNWREGHDWIIRFLAYQPATLAPYLRGRAQLGIAHFTHAWADYAIALTHYEAALNSFKQVEVPNREVEWYIAWALGQSEGCHYELKQFDQAKAVAEESLHRFKQLGDEWAIGMITWHLAILCEKQEEYARAEQLAEETFAIFQRINATSSLSFVAIVRGNVARAQSDIVTAEQHYLTAVAICRSNDNQDGMAWTLQLAGEAILIQNDGLRAIPYLLEALTLRNTMGHDYALHEVLQGLALAFASLQRDTFATCLLSASARDQRGDSFLLISQQLRPLYDQTRAELQKRLGNAWKNEWAQGQVATTIDLIALCRAEEAAMIASHSSTQAASVGRGSLVDEGGFGLDPIVRTRLHPPRLRTDTLHRSRLVRSIRNALGDVRLVLIAAPAGFGKTTLLTSALQQIGDLSIAWLSVEAEDDGLARFLRILGAALHSLVPNFKPPTPSSLGSGTGEAQALLALGRTVMSELINELFDLNTPCAIVLDDLHMVSDSAIYATLDFLIDRLPPTVTLVIATRHDPPVALAQLRARRELLEIRLEELRFTTEEAKALLNQHLGLALASTQIEALTQRTEGWATGMTLIANSLERIETPTARAAFLEQFTRSNRYIFDYLADAVLNREDQATHDFLLTTSILDELTPEACMAVSGRTDAALILDTLYRRNLFLVALDGVSVSGTTYRYNDLFREFLRGQLNRLPAEQIRDLHLRAGTHSTRSEVRIEHFVQAQAWDEAAATITQVGEALIEQGWMTLVRDWIAKLPLQVVEAQPRLAYLMGVCTTLEWELAEAQRWLRRAQAGFASGGTSAGDQSAGTDTEGETATLVYLAACLSAMNDADTEMVIEQAMTRRLQTNQRIQLLGVQSIQAFDRFDFQRSLAYVEEALTLAEMQPTHTVLNALIFSVHSVVMRQPGAIPLINRLVQLLRNHSKDNLKVAGFAAVWQAWAYCWRGNWEAALQSGAEAIAISAQLGDTFSIGGELSFLVPVCTALRGDNGEAALQALSEVINGPIRAGWRESWIAGFFYEIGRVRWHQNRVTEAETIYEQAVARTHAQERSFAPAVRALLRALLLISANKLRESETLLQETLAQNRITPYHALHGQAMLAYIALLQGKDAVAMSTFAPVLDLYAQQGTPGHVWMIGPRLIEPLLKLALARNVQSEFVRSILTAMGKLAASVIVPATGTGVKAAGSTTFRIPTTGEVLTERELDVLRLLARGADNPTIAEELIVSIHTVKTHVAHILGKLGVPSRTAAALRAKEWEIV